MSRISLAALAAMTLFTTSGCAAMAAADLAIGATGAVVGTAGKVVGTTVDVITPGKAAPGVKIPEEICQERPA